MELLEQVIEKSNQILPNLSTVDLEQIFKGVL
jgi:hypothetical protein